MLFSMIVALLYSPLERTDPLPFLWWFYKLVNSFSDSEIVFISESEDYFKDPALYSPEVYHALRADAMQIYGYKIPSAERLSGLRRTIFNLMDCKEAMQFEDSKSFRRFLFTNQCNGFVECIRDSLVGLRREGLTPSSFLYWGDSPNIRMICQEEGLPFVSTELGPFRNWMYANNGQFALGGISNNDLPQIRYRQFSEEISNNPVPIFSKEKIQSIFLEDTSKAPCKDEVPTFDLGIAFPYSEFQKEKFQEFLEISRSFSGKVLGRIHPTDYENSVISHIPLDNSLYSLDFIKKCKRIITAGSNLSVEALLWEKPVFTIGEASHTWLAHRHLSESLDESCSLEAFNFYIFGFLVPLESCFDKSYIEWRIARPSEREIYLKNIEYWLIQHTRKRVDDRNNSILSLQQELSSLQEDIVALQQNLNNAQIELNNTQIELNNTQEELNNTKNALIHIKSKSLYKLYSFFRHLLINIRNKNAE